MRDVKDILHEIDDLLTAVDSHHPDTVTNHRAVSSMLADLKAFILSPSTEHTHEEIQYRLDARGYHFKCKKCDQHLRIEKYGS